MLMNLAESVEMAIRPYRYILIQCPLPNLFADGVSSDHGNAVVSLAVRAGLVSKPGQGVQLGWELKPPDGESLHILLPVPTGVDPLGQGFLQLNFQSGEVFLPAEAENTVGGDAVILDRLLGAIKGSLQAEVNREARRVSPFEVNVALLPDATAIR